MRTSNLNYISNNFKTNLKLLLEKKQATQKELANYLKISPAAVNLWIKGRELPELSRMCDICAFFGVSEGELLNGIPSPTFSTIELEEQPPNPLHPSEKGVRVPVLGYVAAGIPIEAVENIVGYEEISADWIRSRDVFFGLVVRGASMYPQLIDGDIVIIKQTPTVESGEIAVVQLANLGVTLKEIKREPNGIWLIGYNKDVYPPRFFTNEQIQNLPITILGKVVELRRKWK
ncbi:MAG: helix-turn-helix domain-containing protein [Selenomonadaceae bacterium]|nr:helix-turn-helix domain-containing protein [Selenomonadaceae bacterium]